MNRSMVVAALTMLIVAFATAPEPLRAQSRTAGTTPVELSGGTPGANVDFFANGSKTGDTTLDSLGAASSVLNLLNIGKLQVRLYVDTCQDGHTVKVLVESGTPAPEDKGCKRRTVGAPWQTDCGVTRITVDLRKFTAHVIGCAKPFYTQPKYDAPILGGVLLPFVLGGGHTTTVAAPAPVPTAIISTPAAPTTPPVTVAPVTPPTPTAPTTPTTPTTPTAPAPTAPTSPTPTGPASIFVTECVTNFTGFSTITLVISVFPPLEVEFSIATSGPAVRQPTVTGRTTSAGTARATVDIGLFGSYSSVVSAIINGATVSGTGNINVTATTTCTQG